MSVNSEQFVTDYANAMAPMTQRQMPVFSQMGKGLRGDSATLELYEDGIDSSIKGKYVNVMTGEETELWQLPIINLAPKLHYEIWGGVRDVDNVYMNGYYIKLRCEVDILNHKSELWNFQTPFAMTSPFMGSTIPADWLIDSDESE